MGMKRIAWIAIALCLLAGCAYADVTKMSGLPADDPQEMGFSADTALEFLSGCRFENGAYFALVDTDFNDAYLIVESELYELDSISGGLPVPDGWQTEVTAADETRCTVRMWHGNESRSYEFAFDPTAFVPERWVLRRYEERRAGVDFEAQFEHDRVQATEKTSAGTQEYTAYYAFFHEAYNLTHEKMPHSIENMNRLEKEYPVAAVSPDDPASRVNLRKGPSTKTERVGSVYSGTRFRIQEITEDGWAKVQVSDTYAYISTEYLTFGAAIDAVADARPTATLEDGEWVEVSRVPYRGGGGSVTHLPGRAKIRVIGEYNAQWRIICEEDGARSFYIQADKLD